MSKVRGIERFADAEDFFTDFASYVNRQTNRKERVRLQGTLSFLEKVYL